MSRELDVRDKRMGVRMLRKGYTPIPYKLKDEKGKTFKTGNKAAEAASFLASKIKRKMKQSA